MRSVWRNLGFFMITLTASGVIFSVFIAPLFWYNPESLSAVWCWISLSVFTVYYLSFFILYFTKHGDIFVTSYAANPDNLQVKASNTKYFYITGAILASAFFIGLYFIIEIIRNVISNKPYPDIFNILPAIMFSFGYLLGDHILVSKADLTDTWDKLLKEARVLDFTITVALIVILAYCLYIGAITLPENSLSLYTREHLMCFSAGGTAFSIIISSIGYSGILLKIE